MKKQSLKAFSLFMALLLLLSLSPVLAEKKADEAAKEEVLPSIKATLVSDASILLEPRADAAFVAGLMADTSVDVVSLGLTWCKVDAGLAKGYIASRFLKFADTPEDKVFAVVSANNGRLTLREKPSTKSKSLGKLQNGTVTVFLEEGDNNFTKVAVNGKEGYLLTNHLEFSTAKESVGTGVVFHPDHPGKLRKIKMRWEDKTGSNVIGDIKTSTPVVIVSKGDNWYEIETLGKIGYMMKKYIQEDEAPTATAQPAAPAQPIAPAQPAPAQPVAPAQPEVPAQPVSPAVPAPEAPEQPVVPVIPAPETP